MAMNKPWEILTNRILEALAQGVAPWRRPWNSAPSALAVPANALTHKAYRGINIVMLQLTQQFCGYPTSHWLTFKQARDLGGNVLAGQKATPIAFWKMLSRPGEPDVAGAELEQRTRPMLRLYYVFNVAQCSLPEGVVPPLPAAPEITYSNAQGVLEEMPAPPRIDHIAGEKACYYPSLDRILLPLRSQFRSEGSYWNVLFHELTHATGHPSRLNRKGGTFGDEAYAREELTAEIGAALLCQRAGIALPELEEQSNAYIAYWLKALKNDSRLIVVAAQAAQRAVDHVVGASHDHADETEDVPLAA